MTDARTPPEAPNGGIYITPEMVERARRTGEPVVVRHPDADEAMSILATAEGARRGMARRRETPTTVGIIGGETNTEYNRRLTQADWFGSYGEIGYRDRMPREWPAAQAIQQAWRLAVTNREWRITPVRGGDRTDLMVAKFLDTAIRHHFRYNGGGWDGLIGMFAGLAWDGFVAAQAYYPSKPLEVRDDSGAVVMERAHVLQMAPIAAWVIRDWLPEEGPDGSIRYGAKLYQQTTDGPKMGAAGSDVVIPASRMVLARYMPNGDDPAPYGHGRALYYGYRAQESMRKFLLQGAEKASFGIPQVVIDPDANRAELPTVNTIVSNLRVGAYTRFSLPEGYSIQWHELPWRASDLLDAIEQNDRSAHRGTNTQHLFTGSDNGTQALHGSQVQEFHAGVDVVCKTIRQTLAEGPTDTAPLKMVCSLNFAGLRQFPTLDFGPPPVVDAESFASGLAQGITAGILTPDAGVEARFRDAFYLDDMPEETAARWRHRLENENPPNVMPSEPEQPESEDEPEVDEGGEDADDAEEESDVVAASDAYERAELDRFTSGPRGRPLRLVETVVALSETKGQQDAGKEAMAGVLVRWRNDTAPKYGKVLEDRARTLGDVATIPVPDQKALISDLVDVLRGAYEAGVSSVKRETARLERDPSLLREVERGGAEVGVDIPAPERIALADGHSGAIFMAIPDKAAANALDRLRSEFEAKVGPLESKDAPHVTVLYLGKGLSPSEIREVASIATETLTSGSISVDVAGLATFEASEASEGRIPVIVRLESDALTRLHERLLRRTAALNRQRQFDEYVPHMTLGYWAGGDLSLPDLRMPPRVRLERVDFVAGTTRVSSHGAAMAALAESHTPPAGVRAAARRALEVREGKPESQRGMTPVGLARARDLSNGRPVSMDTLRRMKAYFDRHEVDKKGATWDEQGKGWQAWMGWGGDAGRRWAESILSRVAACDCGAHAPMLHGVRLRDVMALAEVKKPKKAKGVPEPEGDDFDIDPEDSIESVARTTAAAEAARMRQSAMASLQAQGTGGALPAAVAAVVSDAIQSLSSGAERNQAQADVNTIFGLGRTQQAQAQGSQRFVYSNLLESDTCENCEQWDGHVFGADELEFFATPFSGCLGGDKCGCLVIAFPQGVEE